MQNFDLDNFEPVAKIVVIGVGGGGNNAVNRMIDDEIENVDFVVANTDKQVLSTSKCTKRLILGNEITGGLGAGGEPEVGRQAAEASADDIKEIVKDAKMVFITAGLGGGTGTGAAPVIARLAKEAGALVLAIVTRPFQFEGKKRFNNSIDGLRNLKENVDSIIVVSNDKLLVTCGTVPINEAFSESDKVLAQSVKTVVDLILKPALINLDFADVKATLKDSGVALIGFGLGTGPDRAKEAAQNAVNSPLLEASMHGARRAIVAVTCGPNVSLFNAQECVNILSQEAGEDFDVKFGVAINPELNDEILVSVIATDFNKEVDVAEPPMISPSITPITAHAENEEVKEENNTEEKKEEENDDDFLKDILNNM